MKTAEQANSLFKIQKWQIFLFVTWIAGILLRVLFSQDMEYKEDEEYNFTQTQCIGVTQPWPWYGIASGVYLVNPGMSIWVFVALARLFCIHQPTHLAHAVQLFAILGMSLILPFMWLCQPRMAPTEQRQWLWAFALAMVNPFLILYHRKLWPEPFLPFFTMLVLMGWWTRSTRLGAMLWGWIGAWLGQIHMSGFFFSAALFLWTLFFDPHKKTHSGDPHAKTTTHWKMWFLGSVFGALPLIPWILYIIQHPLKETMTVGWSEMIQFKYWVFWITDPIGLHLGNTLGVFRGPSHWDQIADFIRYPLIRGKPTYWIGLAHTAALLASIAIGIRALPRLRHLRRATFIGSDSNTAFLQNSAFWGCGLLLTLTGIMIRRYYMAVTFPLEFLFLARLADPESRVGHRLLVVLWIAELMMSAGFVYYIHIHHGSLSGDYGEAYGVHHLDS